MKNIIYTLKTAVLSVMVLTACNSSPQPPEQYEIDSSDVAARKAARKTAVYLYQKDGDTISLELHIEGKRAAGKLYYSLMEKDVNTGTIDGFVNDSIVIADYTFWSEGVESVRQVAFKLKEDKAIEGFGPVKEVRGKMVFQDSSSLTFNETMPLLKQ